MLSHIDIHSSSRALEKELELVRNRGVSPKSKHKRPITARNAELLLEYDKTRALEGVKPGTRMYTLNKLLSISRLIDKDFDKTNKDDIKSLVLTIDSKYTGWTRMKLRMTLKRFYKWLKQGDDFLFIEKYPEEVRWIKRGLKKRDEPRVKQTDCWNEDEIKTLLASVTNLRNKAFISILTETGARVGEIGALRIGDVYQDEFGFLVHLKGKTGERDDRVIYSGPYVTDWLNAHPRRNDSNAPLFPESKNGRPLQYQGITIMLKRAVKNAGLVHKRANPHIFRHSRATILAEQGWPEPIIKQYLGWDKDSRMLGTYNHINSRQANNFMLKSHGITTEDSVKPKLEIQVCATCHAPNGPSNKFCKRCGRPLTHEAILKYNHARKIASDEMEEAVKDPNVLQALKEFFNSRNETQQQF